MPIIGEIKSGKDGKFEMPKWMECSWRRIPCNQKDCPLCGHIMRDRSAHIDCGEDPDDMKSVFEDVGASFGEALAIVRQDAERMGIDITNIDNIPVPPEPEQFPLYRKVSQWRENVESVLEAADTSGSLWLETEAAADVAWYRNTLTSKTYRQLTNRWEMERGDAYGDVDYAYTSYVLKECLKILKSSLEYLSLLNSEEKGELMLGLAKLQHLESQILNI
ncbi:MAG: hypothetical protein V1696_03760 [Candidatus Jorgensenbacteria bacterium]